MRKDLIEMVNLIKQVSDTEEGPVIIEKEGVEHLVKITKGMLEQHLTELNISYKFGIVVGAVGVGAAWGVSSFLKNKVRKHNRQSEKKVNYTTMKNGRDLEE